MAFTLIASTSAGSANGSSVFATVSTAPIDTTGADLIVVGLHFDDPFSFWPGLDFNGGPEGGDSKGNTGYQTLTGQVAADGSCCLIAYMVAPAVGAGHTFTFNSSYCTITVAAFAGASATPFGVENGAIGSGTSLSSGSVTPSANDMLVVSLLSRKVTGAVSVANGGLAISDQVAYVSGGSGHVGGAMAYEIQTTAAARSALWSFGSSDASAAIATFFSGPSPITGSFVAGVHGTVTASQAVLFSLNGDDNTNDTEGLFKIAGDFEVTGEATIVDLVITGSITGAGVSSGDVVGPGSATAEAVAFFDGTSGKLLKNASTTATPQLGRVGIGAAADANSKLKIAGDYWSPTVAAGNSSTAKTLDWRDGNTQLLTLTGNCTLTLSNPQDGARYLIALKQDGTGSRTVTWPSSVKWTAATAPTLTTGAGLVDIITLVWFANLGASGNYIAAASQNFTPA